ncbi:MAG: hypothetical protein AAB363_10130, partial [Planctomycetota bacterium]
MALLHLGAKAGALSLGHGPSAVARGTPVAAEWYAGHVLPSALSAPPWYDAFDSADDDRKRAVRAMSI